MLVSEASGDTICSTLRVPATGKYASTKVEGYLYSASLLQGFKVPVGVVKSGVPPKNLLAFCGRELHRCIFCCTLGRKGFLPWP